MPKIYGYNEEKGVFDYPSWWHFIQGPGDVFSLIEFLLLVCVLSIGWLINKILVRGYSPRPYKPTSAPQKHIRPARALQNRLQWVKFTANLQSINPGNIISRLVPGGKKEA